MPDVSLEELERKLEALEQELARAPRSTARPRGSDQPARDTRPAAHGPVESSSQSPPASSPASVPGGFPMRPPFPDDSAPGPAARSRTPPAGLEPLSRARAELERASHAFLAEYERTLGRLLAGADDALATTALLAEPTGRPARSPLPAEGRAGARPEPPLLADEGAGDALLDGAVTVDAGRFTDIATLTAFEHALVAVDGVHDVYVRGFEGGHAFLDVTLSHPTALADELRGIAPMAFKVTRSGPRHLSVVIQPST